MTSAKDLIRNKILFLLYFYPLILSSTTTYTVGATGNYSTIALAYAACTAATDYVIEIQSDYTTESLPITLSALANKSLTNTVTIRPQTGVSGLTISGTAAQIFYFNGADYVIIDGRPGGSGSGDFTLANTSTSASKRVLEFISTATYNTIRYCTIKGSNATASSTTGGVVYFGNTNNDNNTISNCSLYNASGGNPAYMIVSTGAANPNENDNITISNNDIYNFTLRALEISNNNYSWTISGNSFYQSASITPSARMIVMDITAGYGYSITGNYIGGQSANCGGSAFTLSSSANTAFCAIYLGASVTNTSANTIYNNTFSNMTVTSTTTANTVFCFIETYCSAVTIGASGNGNTFGSTSGTGNITVTDNSSGNSNRAFNGIFYGGSNTNTETCSYNTFGSISITGTNTGNGGCVFIDHDKTAASGILTITNNTIGNTTANNISISMDCYVNIITNAFQGTTNTSVFTVTNNTIQNVNHNASTRRFIVICSDNSNAGTASNPCAITGNTIAGITTASSDNNKIIFHSKTSGSASASNISSNVISNLTLSNTSANNFVVIYVVDNISATTCNTNTIGSTTSNNITYAGSNGFWGISYEGSSTFTANSNVVQQVNLTGTGSSVRFNGIHCFSGICNFSNDTVQNITSAQTNTSAWTFAGIVFSSGSNGQTVTKCGIKNLTSTASGSTAVSVIGIFNDGNGNGSITKSHVSGLKISSTSASAQQKGIYISGSGGWNLYNNAILSNNGGNANSPLITGIEMATTGTNKIYHNSVKIYGTATSGSANSAALVVSANSNTTVKNNVWQNLRTGGTGVHYACNISNTAGTKTFDYNYLETSATPIARWGGTTCSAITNWRTSSGASASEISGTITIDNNFCYSQTSTIQNVGTNLSATVSDDKQDNSRSTSPWMGAWETMTVLPVKLVEFKAERNRAAEVLLSWVTHSEVNNDYFEVERSSDGIHFEKLLKLKGTGNSSEPNYYTGIDTEPLYGYNYYRLSQTDFDGNAEQLGVCVLFYDGLYSENLLVYPNPVDKQQTLYLSGKPGEAKESKQVQLIDAWGRVITAFTMDEHEHSVSLAKLNLSPGFYQLSFLNGSKTENIKVMIR